MHLYASRYTHEYTEQYLTTLFCPIFSILCKTTTLRNIFDGLIMQRLQVEEFKRSKLFSVKQKLTNSLLRCVKV